MGPRVLLPIKQRQTLLWNGVEVKSQESYPTVHAPGPGFVGMGLGVTSRQPGRGLCGIRERPLYLYVLRR